MRMCGSSEGVQELQNETSEPWFLMPFPVHSVNDSIPRASIPHFFRSKAPELLTPELLNSCLLSSRARPLPSAAALPQVEFMHQAVIP